MTGMHKAQREVPAPTQRLFLTRREAAIELRMSLAKLDRVIARGELKAKKHGHSVVVIRRARRPHRRDEGAVAGGGARQRDDQQSAARAFRHRPATPYGRP